MQWVASCQPAVSGIHPPGYCAVVVDQIGGNPGRQRLADAVLRARALRDRAVQRDAQVGALFYHRPVALGAGGGAGAVPVGKACLGRDPQLPACRGEGFVDAGIAAMDDNDIPAVAGNEPAEDRRRQRSARPETVARYLYGTFKVKH